MNFTENLEKYSTIFFIKKEAIGTVLDFFKIGTIKVQ